MRGGLRILAHLRRHLGTVETVGMDVDTFEAYRASSMALTPGDEAALAQLREDAALVDCHVLIQHLLSVHRKLEQEAVAVDRIVELVFPHSA